MSPEDLARLAEEVSLRMQLDRNRHRVGTEIDMQALSNVPRYISRVFEEANAVSGPISNEALYELVNGRISQVQAQLYLMRVEMENRFGKDPAHLYEDPMAISTYAEQVTDKVRLPRSFGFEPRILAHGWFPVEHEKGQPFRWMRPNELSVICLPHMGPEDQIVEIMGYVLHPKQLEELVVNIGEHRAELIIDPANPSRFTARIRVPQSEAKLSNHLAIELRMSDFRQPNDADPRRLGANVYCLVCKPASDKEHGAS